MHKVKSLNTNFDLIIIMKVKVLCKNIECKSTHKHLHDYAHKKTYNFTLIQIP